MAKNATTGISAFSGIPAVPSPTTDTVAWQGLRSRARRVRWGVSTVRRGLRKSRVWSWPPEAIEARESYRSRLREMVSGGIECGGTVPLEVVSFSSRAYLPEQVASIRSFLTHAGRPASWTVVSDGSQSEDDRSLVEAIHPCVEVTDWRHFSQPGLPGVLWDYARVDRMGKKLIALVSLPGDRPVLYTDADILFYAGAGEPGELTPIKGTPLYMQDSELRRGGPLADKFALDEALLQERAEGEEEVNSGFILLNGRLDWTPALQRLEGRRWKPTMFTEQTVVHLTLRQAGCRPLDPTRFILVADDSDQAEDPYVGPKTVLRHYATPVRHKFWTAVSRNGVAA
jgi:hypothetical protein